MWTCSRDRVGVEASCRTLGATDCGFLTPRGYRAAKTRPPSARAIRDDVLGAEIARLHAENYGVYGVRKMHALMRRQGWLIGRDQTGRIVRVFGLEGARRSRRVFTTKPDPAGVGDGGLGKRGRDQAGPSVRQRIELRLARLYRSDPRARRDTLGRIRR